MVRGSKAVAAVAVVILLYVAVIRPHLEAAGGSVDDSATADTVLAVLQRELNGVSGLPRDLGRLSRLCPVRVCSSVPLLRFFHSREFNPCGRVGYARP